MVDFVYHMIKKKEKGMYYLMILPTNLNYWLIN